MRLHSMWEKLLVSWKSWAKLKVNIDGDNIPLPRHKRALEIQWFKKPNWTHALVRYLEDHVVFCLKLFSDSTADTVWEGHPKHTAKDSKAQQYTVLTSTALQQSQGKALCNSRTPVDSLLLWKLVFNGMLSSLHKSIWLTLDHSLRLNI
jgi:hypothetical protein